MRRSLTVSLRAAVVMAAAGLLLTGCNQPDNTPQEYGDATKSLYLSGCTQDYAGTPGTIAQRSTCECSYQVFVDNVPASTTDKDKRFPGYTGKTFAEINHELANDPSKINDTTVVPGDVLTKIKACEGFGRKPGENVGPTASTGGASTGSTGSTAGPSPSPSVTPGTSGSGSGSGSSSTTAGTVAGSTGTSAA